MTCIKMGSDESHFNVSLIVRDKVTRPCPQTTAFLKRKESRSGIEPRSFRLLAYYCLTARPNRRSLGDRQTINPLILYAMSQPNTNALQGLRGHGGVTSGSVESGPSAACIHAAIATAKGIQKAWS